MELSDYSLEKLGTDGEFILYRGQHPRPTSASAPSLLLLTPVSEHPAPASIRRMEHEYALRDELDPAWAVRPLTLASHQSRTMLVLTDPGGEPLDRPLERPMELTPFLRLAVGLASALGQLHGRGLIHKDFKPAHVLVNSATGQVWLTGFGIASRLRRERQSPDPPEFIAGTLPYMAPEQTGRMNRSIDSRSDLYALGVTLYEMVTGSLPFSASDPMEWVHCHIARRPVPPAERLPEVPGAVSAILMKLLAKTAEERYQTAAGVEKDLRRCLAAWETQRRIDDFPLGEHDTPDRLLIPEKLYGREREIATLLASFDRVVKSGAQELVLVSGYSGIGKSSVVNELHKVLVPPRGLFASGKFDQYKRDIPYSTLAQAFQGLVRRLLAKSEADLAPWRDALREALGPNGRLITDLVPELKLIIGEQPPVPDLPVHQAQGRFQMVFRRFIGVFAGPEHPLALFLDDLQWLDAATLDLFEDLLTQADVQHLLVIGAYRDNEVDAAHPLTRKLDAIRKAGVIVNEITLTPLAQKDLAQLIADALQCEPQRVIPLAQLVYDKTAGNPFFAIQFFTALAQEGLLTFDHVHARWSWDLERIHAKGYTENVVDLMVGKLTRLPAEAQKALQELACLGNSAEVTTLSLVHGRSEEQVHADLWEAVHLELIERLDGAYKFVHDRVQEAAYSLIPEGLRAEAHLRIGRLLAAHTPPEKREEVIFEIVNQLNRGAPLIPSQDEREQLAELNLIAGKRAKASTAYASALTYLVAGEALLGEDCWERRQELTFALELNRAECEFLTGALAEAEQRLTALSARAATTVERATVTCLRMDLHVTLDQSGRAVAVGLDYLRHLGMNWSPHPTEEEAHREYERIWSQLGSRSIEDLIELPLMTEPASLATLDVLTKLATPAWHTDANLLSLVVCRAVNLSLEGGNCDGSCYAYVVLGLLAGPRFGDYQAGFQFGRLGYDLVEQRGLTRFQVRTYFNFGSIVTPWTRHVRAGRDLVRRAFEAANKIGDLTFAAYCCAHLNTNLLAAGDPLDEVQGEAERGLAFAQKVRFGFVIDSIAAQLGLIRTLRGSTPYFGCFDDEQFDERRMERRFSSNPDLALPEAWYWIRKLQARFFAGDYAAALEASERAQRLIWTSPSMFETAEYHFYGALTQAASCESAAAGQRRQHFEALVAHHRQLEIWAENCPENFENRAALVGAEIARIEGRALDAMELYEQAIRSAQANGFVHNGALANELAARFYAARGFEQIARTYLREARDAYLRWGADGKVRQLDQLSPHLRQEEPSPEARGTISAPIEQLELATVLKVSQAVSGEIVLEKLIETLLRTAIEHAGAERGLLLLPRGAELRIQAEANTRGSAVTIRLREAPVSAAELPESVVQYATRTLESVILDDASAPNPFSTDEYLRQKHARSVLCLPLVKQGRLAAVLYLENNLAPVVFTPAKMAVLKVLASEAAMSLENSRLYRDLQEREAKIRRLVDANIVGVMISNLDGRILEANDAFLEMVGYSRDDLTSGRLRWTELTPAEWDAATQQAVAQIRATGSADLFEKEYFRKDGSRVPVLVGAAALGETRSESVVFVLDLTERKRAEEAIRRSEKELRDVIETIPTSAWTALPDGSVEFVNRHWREYTGLSAEDSAGSGWQAVVHPEDIDRHADKWLASLATGDPFESEVRYRQAADGQYRWFLARAVPLRDEHGKLLKWYGISTDIDDRKRAEALLAGEKRILELVARGTSLAQILESLCRHVEEQAQDVLASILLVEGNRLRHGGAPSLPKAYTDAIDGALLGPSAGSCGTAAYSGKQVIVSDIASDPLWADYREAALPHSLRACWSTPVFSSEGKVIATFAMYYREPRSPSAREQEIIEQITHLAGVAIQRKLDEEKLRESEERFRNMADTAPVMIWVSGADKLCTYFNQQWLDFTGRTMHEELGEGWAAGVHPDDCQRCLQTYHSAFDRREPFRMEYRLRCSDGQFRWVDNTGVARFSRGGEFLGYIGSCVDITERRRAEEARQMAVLEERSRMAREIHDTLAQAFTGILLQLGAAERVLADAPEQGQAHLQTAGVLAREGLAEARRSVQALRPQALENEDLAAALKRMTEQLSTDPSTQIRFRLTGAPRRLPAEVADHLLRMGQEALTNALRHAQAREVCVELTFTQAELRLCVTDDGRGFALDTPPSNKGFGLTGMRERAGLIGAALDVTSQPGCGTQLQVTWGDAPPPP